MWVHLAASICTEWAPASARRPRTIHRWQRAEQDTTVCVQVYPEDWSRAGQRDHQYRLSRLWLRTQVATLIPSCLFLFVMYY